MRYRVLPCVLLWFWPIQAELKAQQIHWLGRYKEFNWGYMVLDPVNITEARLSRDLNSLAPGPCDAVTQVDAVPPYLENLAFGQGVSHILPEYETWVSWVHRTQARLEPSARFHCYGGSRILEIRRADGTVSHRVLSGSDFLSLNARGITARVLYISTVGRGEPSSPELTMSLRVFVETPVKLVTAQYIALFTLIRRWFSNAMLEVVFRPDAYFIFYGFPAYNPFWHGGLPSREEMLEPTIICLGLANERPKCRSEKSMLDRER